MPDWKEITLTWDQLKVLPSSWHIALEQWRAIYLIFDASTGQAYVGSAYGEHNLLGRWENYAATGHGGNKHLRACDKHNLRFSILQRLNPDMSQKDVIAVENSWKERLHTRTQGLNE